MVGINSNPLNLGTVPPEIFAGDLESRFGTCFLLDPHSVFTTMHIDKCLDTTQNRVDLGTAFLSYAVSCVDKTD